MKVKTKLNKRNNTIMKEQKNGSDMTYLNINAKNLIKALKKS
jgi:hypothetical protein